ncbi:MAG: hypothetical protein ACQEXJ_08425 [Myxococcota bacterium]
MTSHTARLLLLAALLSAAPAACDLPQNEGGGADASTDANGSGEMRTWRMLRLTDDSDAQPSPLPGADLDAVIAFTADDEFLFAGCAQASLFGQDTTRYPENEHEDPWDATLAVREQGTAGGFLSLGGGNLLCELPLAVQTGDRIVVWEVGGDGEERWKAAFAETADDDYTRAGGFEGTAEIVVP